MDLDDEADDGDDTNAFGQKGEEVSMMISLVAAAAVDYEGKDRSTYKPASKKTPDKASFFPLDCCRRHM